MMMIPAFSEAVHLHEHLVQGLLALIIAAAEPRAAMATDGVDLVDEDDARRVLLGLLEHVTDAAGADANEHFHEIRSRDREEGNARLAGDGLGRQRLAGARRADEQHAARDLPAEALELLRVAQEFHDLLQILLGLLDAGDVREGDAGVLRRDETGARAAEGERPAIAATHVVHGVARHPQRNADEDHDGQQRPHQAAQQARPRRRDGRHLDVVAAQHGEGVGVFRREGRDRPAVGADPLDDLVLDAHRAHLAAFDGRQERGIRHRLRAGTRLGQELRQNDRYHGHHEHHHAHAAGIERGLVHEVGLLRGRLESDIAVAGSDRQTGPDSGS